MNEAPKIVSVELPILTASELVATGECTGTCLTALHMDCDCKCGGYYHGALADVVIDRSPRRNDWIEVTTADGTQTVQIDSVSATETGWAVSFGTKEGWHYTYGH